LERLRNIIARRHGIDCDRAVAKTVLSVVRDVP
jgi:hypothetical protein